MKVFKIQEKRDQYGMEGRRYRLRKATAFLCTAI